MLKIIVLSVALSYLGAGLPVNSSATTILAKIKSTATYSIKCSEAVKRSVLSWNGHTDCRQFRYGLMALEQVLQGEVFGDIVTKAYLDEEIDLNDIKATMRDVGTIADNYLLIEETILK